MKTHTLLLADDCMDTRLRVQHYLDPDRYCIRNANNAFGVWACYIAMSAMQKKPELVVLNPQLRFANGNSVLTKIMETDPQVKLLLLDKIGIYQEMYSDLSPYIRVVVGKPENPAWRVEFETSLNQMLEDL